ncbi:MAG TPA: sn-glycerol-3-phosphate ABC transporter ATP-binding protein UgpC [Dehalococcoidia bacterium]|nr:sn-glycerol-3-phosphate ABC transporter ATP-binding protein UgpC [Dehalococcoidia bacterium]
MAGVTLDRVTKRFGTVEVVKAIDLAVHDREFLVLVGPSGCGKSTTLRLVAGLEEVTAGRILIGDRVVNDVPAKDRDIAMVFQSYALYPHMSVFDNLAFGLQLRRVPRREIRRRVQNAAEILGLEGLLRRKPRELSGGQRQRVALGRAIVREPQVFLMDEPLSNLDAKLRVQTRAELLKLHQRLQTTVVYVTHDQVEAMTMGSRIAVMDAGTIQQLDTPQRIYEHPVNMFVAAFIGSPAMNFIPARVTGRPDAPAIETPDFRLPVPASRLDRPGELIGREVTAGIRPEHITYRGPEPAGEARIVARIDLVEILGYEAILHLVCGGTTLVARTPYDHDLEAGRTIVLVVDLKHLHLFDPGTEQSLIADGRAG